MVRLSRRGEETKKDLEGARAAYEAVLRAVPRRVDALSNLGVVFDRQV